MAEAPKPSVPEPKKRVALTVLQQHDVSGADALETARSPWSWVGLGAMATLTAMVPLSMLAALPINTVYRRPDGTMSEKAITALVLAAVVTLAVASSLGGYLIGRFGGRARAREGAASGLLSGLAMWLLTLGTGGKSAFAGLAILLVTVPSAFRGARIGVRARKPGDG